MKTKAAVVAALLAILAAACSSSVAVPPSTSPAPTTPSAPTTSEVATSGTPTSDVAVSTTRPVPSRPVRMGRANWASGYVEAEIVSQLLEEVGYEVLPASEREFAPDLGYRTLAEGEMDLWANGWFPGHVSWFEGETREGERIGDLVSRFDEPLIKGGGLQGYLATKSWLDEFGIVTLNEVIEIPKFREMLDSDGDGAAEVYGCPEDWTCDDIINGFIWYNEWARPLNSLVEQVQAPYDDMWEEFMVKVRAGEPAIAYTWTPTRYFAEARPGVDTMWLSTTNDSFLDECNPFNDGGGCFWQIGDDGTLGFTDLPDDVCTQGPDGCQLGWLGADIEIVANSAWLEAEPVARALLDQVRLDIFDLSVLSAERDERSEAGEDPVLVVQALAEEWIADNRELVDEWVAHALG